MPTDPKWHDQSAPTARPPLVPRPGQRRAQASGLAAAALLAILLLIAAAAVVVIVLV